MSAPQPRRAEPAGSHVICAPETQAEQVSPEQVSPGQAQAGQAQSGQAQSGQAQPGQAQAGQALPEAEAAVLAASASATPPSPCVSLCKMNPETGLCQGCLRTLDEIVQWSKADDDFKRAVWIAIRQREQHIQFD